MKQSIVKTVITALLLFNCGSGDSESSDKLKPVLTDVLTLELTFGDKDLPDEYLLAKPNHIAVNTSGDVIVEDEGCLKTYDENGQPKRIIGRSGEAPNEFRYSPRPYVTETGFITGLSSNTVAIISPDGKIIKKERADDREIDFHAPKNYILYSRVFYDFWAWSQEEMLFHIESFGMQDKQIKEFHALAYIIKDRTTLLSSFTYEIPYIYMDGLFHVSPLKDRRISYINARDDRALYDKSYTYIITIYNLATNTAETIKKEYTPVPVSADYYDIGILRADIKAHVFPEYKRGYIEGIMFGQPEGLEKTMNSIKTLRYYAPVEYLMTDGDIIFVFLWNRENEEGNTVDTFDSRTGEYISVSHFPFKPDAIRNGYAYRVAKNNDGFYVVEKYRIDPAVYRK